MKTIAHKRLTQAYLQKLDRQIIFAITVAVCIVTIELVGMILGVGGSDKTVAFFPNCMYVVAALLSIVWVCITAYRGRYGPLQVESRYQLAWLLAGLGLLATTVGRILRTYHIGELHAIVPLGYIGTSLFFPLIFASLLVTPTGVRFRTRLTLDALITTLCLLGVAWFFVIGPTVMVWPKHPHAISIGTFIIMNSYPVWDMLLILAIVLFVQRRIEPVLRPWLLLCGLALVAMIWANMSVAYFTTLGTYVTGTYYIDPFWSICFLFIGLAGFYQYRSLARKAYNEHTSLPQDPAGHTVPTGAINRAPTASGKGTPLLNTTARSPMYGETAVKEHIYDYNGRGERRFLLLWSFLVYCPLFVLWGFLFYSEVMQHNIITFFLIVCTGIVSVLVAIRYLLTMQENQRFFQQLRDAHRRQQELDQLKDQFMMTASHEVRTPLTAVQGYLELVTHYGDELSLDRRQEFLGKARRSCDELVVMLGNIMDASRLEGEAGIRRVHLERVQVQEMIQSVINLIGPYVTQEQREIEVDVPGDLYVQADAGSLRQVLLNLSTNALKYSPARTPIAFSAHALGDGSSAVVISVTDKGSGIAAQDQEYLFQRFVRLKRDINSGVRGTGLGLYISRRLIEVMDGKIRVESSGIEGEGSTFSIQLPSVARVEKQGQEERVSVRDAVYTGRGNRGR